MRQCVVGFPFSNPLLSLLYDRPKLYHPLNHLLSFPFVWFFYEVGMSAPFANINSPVPGQSFVSMFYVLNWYAPVLFLCHLSRLDYPVLAEYDLLELFVVQDFLYSRLDILRRERPAVIFEYP